MLCMHYRSHLLLLSKPFGLCRHSPLLIGICAEASPAGGTNAKGICMMLTRMCCAGVAYTAVEEPETVGGTARVSSVEIKKAGESVQTNGGARAAGSIIAWSEYSNTELYIDPTDPSIFAIYTAVPYAGPARSSGTAALPSGGTWIGYIPRADMVLGG